MLISQEASQNRFAEYKVVNEQEFDCLALIDSVSNAKTCIFLEDKKYIEDIPKHVSMVITTENLANLILCSSDKKGVVITENPKIFFFMLHNHLADLKIYRRPDSKTVIHESAQISTQTFISETNVYIGKNVIIEPFVTIYPNVIIGDNTIIRTGAVIGGEGFEFKRNGEKILSVRHTGGVKLGQNVEIQNGACIDKAIYPWDDTMIGDFSKIDNVVHVAHAAKIGKRVLIAAGAIISGRVELGDDTWVGVGTTIRNGISVGKKARVNIGAVVTKNVQDRSSVTGNFAVPHERFIENLKAGASRSEE